MRGIETGRGAIALHLGGVDLLDGTPVLDVKPYLPYSDAVAGASAGYAGAVPREPVPVVFTRDAEEDLACCDPGAYPDLKALIAALLAQDPRPAYQPSDSRQPYGMRLWDLNIRFSAHGGRLVVESITRLCR